MISINGNLSFWQIKFSEMNLIHSLDVFVLPKRYSIFPLQSYLRFYIKGCETSRPVTNGSCEVPVINSRLRTETCNALCDCSIFLPVPLQSKYMPIYIIQNLHLCHCHYSDLQSVLASEGIYSSGKAATLPKSTGQGGQGKGLTGKYDSEGHDRSRWRGVMLQHSLEMKLLSQ